MRLDHDYVEKGSPEYPPSLLDLRDPPAGLYVVGNKKCLLAGTVGFVGSRKMSPYGSLVTKRILAEVSKSVVLVSGFVDGVDSWSHACALDYGIPTVAVLGYGLRHTFVLPKRQLELAQMVIDKGGCLLSEYPPEFSPTKWSFVKRNRLISAISRCLVVIEACESSGSLITANVSLRLGRKVFTVPRNLYEAHSFGFCHLISRGADVLTSGCQISAYLGFDASSPIVIGSQSYSKNQYLIDHIRLGPRTLDELVKLGAKAPEEIILEVNELELAGIITCVEGLYYVC